MSRTVEILSKLPEGCAVKVLDVPRRLFGNILFELNPNDVLYRKASEHDDKKSVMFLKEIECETNGYPVFISSSWDLKKHLRIMCRAETQVKNKNRNGG